MGWHLCKVSDIQKLNCWRGFLKIWSLFELFQNFANHQYKMLSKRLLLLFGQLQEDIFNTLFDDDFKILCRVEVGRFPGHLPNSSFGENCAWLWMGNMQYISSPLSQSSNVIWRDKYLCLYIVCIVHTTYIENCRKNLRWPYACLMEHNILTKRRLHALFRSKH